MYIDHKQYLALLDQIDYLRKDNTLLKQQNAILAQQLTKEQRNRLQQQQNHLQSMKVVQDLHAQAIAYEVNQKQSIMHRIEEMQTSTKEFFSKKIENLQQSSLTQVQRAELENARTKLGYLELMEFVGKVRGLYNATLKVDFVKNRKQASLMELIKWLKTIPGVVAVDRLSKTRGSGFAGNTTMSMSMTNFSSMKKQSLNKSRLKENKSILNCSQSKLKAKHLF